MILNNNKKAFTLIELVLYIAILLIVTTVTLSLFQGSIGTNEKQSLLVEKTQNVAKAQKYIGKAFENVKNIILLKHTDNGTNIGTQPDITINNVFFRKHKFNFNELKNKCNFIVNNDFDLIALETKDGLDPVVIGSIEKNDENGRRYRQLAIYKYYSLYYQKDLIDRDVKNGKISNIIDSFGNYGTEGLTSYKCNPANGFLIPFSSKFYIDEILDYDYTTFLSGLKILSYVKTPFVDEIRKYKSGLIEIELDWETRIKGRANTDYQVFSQNFKY